MSKHNHSRPTVPSASPKAAGLSNVILLRPCAGGRPNAAAKAAFKQGSRLRAAGDIPGAIAAFKQALAEAPGYLDAANELGLALFWAEDLVQAQLVLRQALTLAPDNAVLLNNLACLWLKLGNFQEGIATLERAIRQAPAMRELRLNLTIARREQGYVSEVHAALTAPAGPARISLCLIAKNEAANLPRLLESLAGAVDEMIVVDTGSTDGTAAVARRYQAAVADFPWRNDFAAAKNEALKHATGDWILFLDADMALEAGHAARVRQAVASGRSNAYYVTIRSLLADGITEDLIAQPWLFKRAPGIQFEGAIHEQVYESLRRAGVEPLHTDILVHHFGFATAEGLVPRYERNLAALRAELDSDRAKPITHYYLGTTLLGLNRPAEAIAPLRKAMAMPELYWRVRANAQLALIRALSANGQTAEAEACADDAATLYPQDRMTWTFRGQLAMHNGQAVKAVESLERALALKEVQGAEADVQRVSDAGLEQDLAQALAQAGRLPDASVHFERALAQGLPDALARNVRSRLAFLYFVTGQPSRAEALTAQDWGEPAWVQIEALAAKASLTERVQPFCEWLAGRGLGGDAVRVRLGRQAQDSAAFVDGLIASAQSLRSAGQLQACLSKLEQAQALLPTRPGLNYELGVTYVQAGDRLKAARSFVAELAQTPTHAASAHDIGVLYTQEGNFSEAASWFELAVKLNPGFNLAQRHLQEARERVAA